MGLALFAVLFTFDIEFSIGQFATVSIWLIVATPLLVWTAGLGKNLGRVIVFAVALSAFFVTHQLFASLFLNSVPISRSLTVGPVFAVSAALLFSSAINNSEKLLSAIVIATKTFLIVQFSIQLAELLFSFNFIAPRDYQHYFLPMRRVSGLFLEPSHLGVALAIPVVFLVAYPKIWMARFRVGYTALFGLIALVCPSATLLATVVIAIALLGLRSGRNAAALSILGALIFVWGSASVYENRDSDPIAMRIYQTAQAISGESPNNVNRSSMVLAKGFYIARRVLMEKPLGFGFDNASYANEDYGFEYGGREWRENDKDLVSIYSKVAAEMGWIGLLALILGILFLVRAALRYKTEAAGILSMIALGLLLANIVRGSGYFSQGVILPFIWCWVLVFERRPTPLRQRRQAALDRVRPAFAMPRGPGNP
ncbi:MAG: hypothetical protein Q7T19_16235 [Caulobacter sp.]|nr:hypothetical protein [Caulobacter sp.]